jgi:hypothetical protein
LRRAPSPHRAAFDGNRRKTAMTTPAPDLASLAARVERLERQNRVLKRALGPALAVALLVSLAAGLVLYRRGLWPRQPWSSFKTVDAETFVLRDLEGNRRLLLTSNAKRVLWRIEDPKGDTVKELTWPDVEDEPSD